MNQKDIVLGLRVLRLLCCLAAVVLLVYLGLTENAMGDYVNQNTWVSYILWIAMAGIALTVLSNVIDAYGKYVAELDGDSWSFAKLKSFREWIPEFIEGLHERIENPSPATVLFSTVFAAIPIVLTIAFFVLRFEQASATLDYFGWLGSIVFVLASTLVMAMLVFLLDLGGDSNAS
jgi:hypothetical protein